MLYQGEATLPVDLQFMDESSFKNMTEDNLENYSSKCKDFNESTVFDEELFKKTVSQMINMRNVMEEKALKNMGEAQKRQRHSYAKRHNTGFVFKVGDKVLTRNLARDDRKGGWRDLPWQGPYEIGTIYFGNTCILKNGEKYLKKKYHLKNLKAYHEQDTLGNINADKSVAIGSTPHGIKHFEYIEINNNTRVFNPVTKPWQIRQSKAFNIITKHFINYKYKGKNLGEPATTKEIVGDGNCLFRSLSYWITGIEDYHKEIRERIAEVVKRDEKVEQYVGGKNKLQFYLQNNAIQNNGVWGTDVEIFAAAFLLNTTIYVYSTSTNTWQLFHKNMTLKTKIFHSEKCIYLRNINNVHYDVVTDVK